jgi:hypothetical protein
MFRVEPPQKLAEMLPPDYGVHVVENPGLGDFHFVLRYMRHHAK